MKLLFPMDRREKTMKAYMKEQNIKAEKNGKIYILESIDTYDGYNTMHLNMVNVEDQEDTTQEICYFVEESVKECLQENDYKIV